jgi:hypothetical protein
VGMPRSGFSGMTQRVVRPITLTTLELPL